MKTEPKDPPFRIGQCVKHKSGMLGVVTRCERRVCQGTTRVCLTVEYHPGSKLCDWYADNCELVEDVKPEPTDVESELTSATPLALPHPVCRGCSKPLDKENLWMAEGCPCNSERGVNHGLVPVNVCTCKECDPAQTGSPRAAAHPKPTLTIPNVGTITLGKSETYVGTFDLEPETLGEQGEFVGVSEINGSTVHAVRSPVELFVANLTAALVNVVQKYRAAGREELAAAITTQISFELGSLPLMPVSQHKATDDVRKEHIETLRAKVAELEERSKEANAELVRSAQTAATLANRIQALTTALGYSNGERNQAQSELDKANQRAGGWREVVAKCERLMQMNGSTPTDPATSAVPLQLEHRLKCLASLEKRIESAHLVLDGKSAEVAS